MDGVKISSSSVWLQQRRQSVDKTLRHLEKERRQVEQNTQWMDHLAYRNRLSLLDRLTHWYREEMGQIDQALGGSSKIKYRICAACHEPIGAHRLDADPDAKLCAECNEYRRVIRPGKPF